MIRLVLSIAASILSSSLLSGCAPQTSLALSFRSIEWSEKVRPDLEPLTREQRAAPQTLFSDGGAQGDQPISALYPDFGTDLAGLRRLGYAQTLWVPPGTRFVLSYETVLTEPHLNRSSLDMTNGAYSNQFSNPPLKAHAGAVSDRGGTEPVTRGFLVYPRTNPPSVYSPAASNVFVLPDDLLHIALEACTNGPVRRNVDNPPGALTEECTRRWVRPERCDGVGRFTKFPFTVLKCVLVDAPMIDSTYRLVAVSANDPNQLADVDYPGSTQTPKTLGNIKVSFPGRILRRATDGAEECRVPDGVGGVAPCDQAQLSVLEEFRVCSGRIPHPRGVRLDCDALTPVSRQGFDSVVGLWTFSVADPVTGGFRENFLAGVTISHVKAFAVRPQRNAPRRYLTPNEITQLLVAIGVVGAGRINASCRVETEAATGHAWIDPQNCSEDIRPLTVAWAAGQTDTPSRWTLVQRVPSEASVRVGQFCPTPSSCRDVNATDVLTRDLTVLPDETVVLEFHLRR